MKGLPRSLARAAFGAIPKSSSPPVVLRHRLRAEVVAIEGTAVGFGTVVLGALPVGNVVILAATAYLTTTEAAAEIATTFDGDFAIGTVATIDVDVSDSGEADIIPSTAMTTAVASVSPRTRATNVTPLILDNTDGSLEVNLNILIDDADISGDADVTVDCDVDLVIAVLNDD